MLDEAFQSNWFVESGIKIAEMHRNNLGPRKIVLGAFKALAAQVIDGQIGEYQSSPVLEVGCGDDFFRDWLAPEWLRSRLIGFDINLPSFGSPLLLVQDATVVLHTPLLGNPDAASS